MGKKTRVIELRTGEGKLILSLYLVESDVEPGTRTEGPARNPETKPEKKTESNRGNGNDELMSEAQRRYLFRILADQGIEGENAYAHLKNLFNVSNIKEASKQEASRAISQLLEQSQGGAGDGPPF